MATKIASAMNNEMTEKSLVLRIFVFSLLILFGSLASANTIEEHPCGFQPTFENAVKSSEAVFLGTALEEKLTPLSGKGGLDLSYIDVKFQVERSWKLVNKNTIWMRVAAKRGDKCGYDGTGKSYLVYANRANDLLYVSPMSRTMAVDRASDDLVRLGTDTLPISEGEFWVFGFTLRLIVSVAVVCLIIMIALIHRMRRNSISRF